MITRFFRLIAGFLLSILNDLFVLAGISLIIWTNFRVNLLFGWYSLGAALILIGMGLTSIIRRRVQK